MNDMASTIIAKSDQINAADLIGAPRTIVIKEVRIKAGEDQPVSILIEGDKKAFKPCKGVRRLIMRVWGSDASKYVGQAMTIFCDPSVTWAGKEEGGIRVSNMSGLDEKIVEYMRTSRTTTKPYQIKPLTLVVDREKSVPANDASPAERFAAQTITGIASMSDLASLTIWIDKRMDKISKLGAEFPELYQRIDDTLRLRREEFGNVVTDDDLAF